ncbi:MAG: replicative DNA helicase [bacterium]
MITPTLDRLPPQNIEAEQSTLGSMLIEKEAIARAAELLHSSDFYRDSHQLIYEAIVRLYERNEPIDSITLTEELRRQNKLEEIGGAPYLTALINTVPTAANVEYYAGIVKDKADLRNLIYAGTTIATMGYEEKEPVQLLMDKAESIVFGISQKRMSRDFLPIGDVLEKAFLRLDELYKRKAHITGVPSGFKELDIYTAGFQPSDLIIIAARPGMGKTSLCLNIAQHVASTVQSPVAIFSLEMSTEQLAHRFLCSQARVNAQKLKTGHLDENEWNKLGRAMGILSESQIFVDDSPAITMLEIRSKARRFKAKHGIALLIIDYLQLIRSTSRSENRNQEISEISRQLKSLSKELDIPVIAISQLSREVEKRTRKRPQLSDLRESGAIEQEADMVIFIYREEENEDDRDVFIEIAKHRNGPTGTIELVFLKEYTKFESKEKFRE